MSGRLVQHVGGDSGSVEGSSPVEGAPSHLVCWNVAKADDAIFVSEVEKILEKIPSGEGVAFCLQEVRSSTYDLIKNLNDGDLSGHYAPSWQYPFAGESTGVLTISNRLLPREGVKHLLSPVREFNVSSPKVSLLTGVPLGNGDNLQIVNCHGLNFVPTAAFAAQLDDVFGALELDGGPAIVCGDFNVWSPERLSILRNKAVTAGLTEAATEKPLASPAPDWLRKIDVFAGFDPDVPFDRVFTRDIEVSHCYAVDDTVSSDHAPIVLRFRAGVPVRPDGPTAAGGS
jgi:endonuclease/exonuclease/phosphatase family metal-dependent hydrolase